MGNNMIKGKNFIVYQEQQARMNSIKPLDYKAQGGKFKRKVTALISSLSYFVASLSNNVPMGRLTYGILILLEHSLMLFFLVYTSTPNSNQVHDIVDLSSINIVDSRRSTGSDFAICCTIYGIICLVFLMMVYIIIWNSEYCHIKETSILKRVFAVWIAFQRTLVTFFIAFCAILSIKQIINLPSTSLEYFILILMTVFGLLIYLILFLFAFRITWTPMGLKRIPWSCIFPKYQFLKEIFKALLISQEIFIPSLATSVYGQAGYFAGLLIVAAIFTIYRPIYFDSFIDRLCMYSERIVLSVCLLCVFRILFEALFLQVLILFPVVTVSIVKGLDFTTNRKEERFLTLLDHRDLPSPVDFQELILFLSKILERQDIADLQVMQRIQHNHRETCFEADCFCHNYQYINIEYFTKDSKSQEKQLSIDAENEEESVDKSNNSPSPSPSPDHRRVELKKKKSRVTFAADLDFVNRRAEEDKSQNEIDTKQISIFLDNSQHHPLRLEDTIDRGGTLFGTSDNISSSIFNASIVVNDLSIDDLFKSLFKNEQLALKIDEHQQTGSKFQNPQQTPLSQLKFKDIKEARYYYFIWLLDAIFRDMQVTHQPFSTIKSTDFHIVYIDFVNQVLQRHFLGIFELLRLNKAKSHMNFMDNLTFSISEQIMISEAQVHFKNKVGGMDYSMYIKGNYQQQQLDRLYEVTTTEIISFWKLWKSEQPNLQQIIDNSRSISRNVSEIKRLTEKLQEDPYVRKDVHKYQIFALFHLELLNDPLTSYHMHSFIQNQINFRSKPVGYGGLVGNGISDQHSMQPQLDQGICIAQAWGGTTKNWEFLYGNKPCCDIVGCKESQIGGQNINLIMPHGIAVHHDEFIQRFYHQGHPRVLGKLRVLYIKDLEGYLVPISFRLNFYYHPNYNYSFIATLEKQKFMNLYFEDNSKILTDDAMVFLTDDAMNITEFSKNVLTFIGITQQRWQQQEEVTGKQINLSQLIVNLDDIMQSEFGTTLTPNNDTSALANKKVEYRRFNASTDQFDEGHTIPAIMVYFQQVFPTQFQKLNVHTFILVPCHKLPEFETGPDDKGGAMNRTLVSNYNGLWGDNPQPTQGLSNNLGSKMQKQATFKSLVSHGASQHSSVNDHHFEMASQCSSLASDNLFSHLANNMLFKNKTPRVILLNMVFIITALIIFQIVSIYNLSIFLVKYQDISGRQESFHYIEKRNINIRASILDIKVLMEISQNLQMYNQSSVIPAPEDRVQVYISDLKKNLEQIGEYSQLFDTFIMQHKDFYDIQLNFNDLQFLTEDGDIYTESVSFKHAVNLFTSYADSIDFASFFAQKLPLNVTMYPRHRNITFLDAIAKGKNMSYKLSSLQRSLYFIFENGLYKMQELGHQQVNMVLESSLKQTEDSKKILNITTFISIAIVSMILIVTFPLLTRLQDREFQVFRFFQALNQDMLDQILKKAHKFNANLKSKLDGEKKQSVDEDIGTHSSSDKMSVTTKSAAFDLQSRLNNSILLKISQQISKQDTKMGKTFLMNRKKSSKLVAFSPITVIGQGGEDINSLRQLKQEVDSSRTPKKEEEKKQQDNEDSDDDSSRSSKDNARQSDGSKVEESIVLRNKHLVSQIKLFQIQNKLKLFGVLLTIILYLNSSFLITFYQSEKVFSNDAEASMKVGNYFEREECLFDIFLFMMERIIRNDTIPIRVFSSESDYKIELAVTYTVNQCFDDEKSVQSILKNMPQFFEARSDDIQGFDSPRICSLTYQDDPVRQSLCQTTMDRLLKQGIGGAMQYLLNIIQQVNINFDFNPSQRTSSFLRDMLYQDKLVNSLDFSIYFLKDSLEMIQDIIKTACLSYFEKAKSQYVLIFALYMTATTILSIVLGVFLYKRIKRRLLEIQSALVLIPISDLEGHLKMKIEDFIHK